MEFTEFDNYEKHHKTGSNYICNPPVTDTDVDYVVLCPVKEDFLSEAAHHGWEVHSDEDYPEDDDFCSVRNGNVNLIVTESIEFYGRFVTATELCKRLNTMEKSERVSIFQGILYGNLSA